MSARYVESRPDYLHGQKYDAVIVGGGPVGVHSAYNLDRSMGGKGKILALTQEDYFGGLSQRSLEQYRQFQQSYNLAWMVDRTQQFYDEVATENGGREPTTTPFPYIFTVDEEHADLLKVYKKIIDDTKAWGFDSKGEIVDADILRQEYSFLDGDTLIGAAIIQNSGRLHFDHVKDEMMRRTRYNPAGKTNGKTVYATGVRAEEIMMGKGDKVTGVRTNRGTVYTPQVVMAPGAGILNLQNQLPRGVDVGSIVDKVNVHQRELFFAPVKGFKPGMNAFVISPDFAIVRYEISPDGTGYAIYGYAEPDEPKVVQPSVDPQPHKDPNEDFVLKVFEMLGKCSSLYDLDNPSDDIGFPKKGKTTAGYYVATLDELALVGALRGIKGVDLAACFNHFGVMTGAGAGEVVGDVVFDMKRVPRKVREEVEVYRRMEQSKSLVL